MNFGVKESPNTMPEIFVAKHVQPVSGSKWSAAAKHASYKKNSIELLPKLGQLAKPYLTTASPSRITIMQWPSFDGS